MGIAWSVSVCLAALFALIVMLRSDRVSFGLPIAYLLLLYTYHLPGAFAHLYDNGFLTQNLYTEIGIRLTALASACFVAGVWLANRNIRSAPITWHSNRRRFWLFCLVSGWIVVFGLYQLHDIPTIGAVADMAGNVWILGVLLALRYFVSKGDLKSILIWAGALSVYPIATLFRGFFWWGFAASALATSALFVSTKRLAPLILGFGLLGFLGASVFLGYFVNRLEIRLAAGSSIQERLDAVNGIFRNFAWFDLTNPFLLTALDLRLNQNYFVGLAAQRIETGQSDYLYGRSLEDAALALIPRVLWPEKPVESGSGTIVADATGLALDRNSSWGVGNVMELEINFGIPGIIIGFFGIGWLLGWLDRKAAIAEAKGELGTLLVCFLAAAALVQPNGSFVDVTGGSAAALLAGYAWKSVWSQWSLRPERRRVIIGAPL